MPPLHPSNDAQELDGRMARLWLSIDDKGGMDAMDKSERDLLIVNLVYGIEEIDGLLTRISVRGNQERSFRTPVVNNDSSLKKVLRRLDKQVKAACIHCNAVLEGPPASSEEEEAIEGMKRVLERLRLEIEPENEMYD